MNKQKIQQIALERIYRLFELAKQEFAKHPERSKRYVQLARKLGTRNKAKIPKELKMQFCKKCGAFLVEEKNAGHLKEGKLVAVKCKECGFVKKHPIVANQ
jgi:ribonuclease P protein subunit RPR2